MYYIYGGRTLVQWIFKVGPDGLSMEGLRCLNDEVREAHDEKRRDPEAWRKSRAPQEEARIAYTARADARRAETYQMKRQAKHFMRGLCSICKHDHKMLSNCLVCMSPVCDGCRRQGFLQCNYCYHMDKVDFRTTEGTVSKTLPEGTCGCCNRSAQTPGQCSTCNRWLCSKCGTSEAPLRCVVCPALVETRLSLREAAQGLG